MHLSSVDLEANLQSSPCFHSTTKKMAFSRDFTTPSSLNYLEKKTIARGELHMIPKDLAHED
jgi:hypothetical protein